MAGPSPVAAGVPASEKVIVDLPGWAVLVVRMNWDVWNPIILVLGGGHLLLCSSQVLWWLPKVDSLPS